MTYNIRHGLGMDKRVNLSRIARVIHESGADIVGLNEVDVFFSKRSEYVNQVEWLANRLLMNHAFAPAVGTKDFNKMGGYGNAVLSRYPIVDFRNHPLRNHGKMEPRVLLEVKTRIEKEILHVFSTHLTLLKYLRAKQVEEILKKVHQIRLPLIFMGDFNARPKTEEISLLRHSFRDCWETVHSGPGYTYPSGNPRKRIDYIFVNNMLKIISCKVETGYNEASDHLPVIATLRLKT